MRTNAHALAAGVLALWPLLVAAGAPALQGEGPLPTTPFRQDDPQQQLIELIQKVELRLIDIDRRLSDASTGSVPLEAVGDSGIDDLLRQASRDSRQTIQDIDKILEIAQQMGGQQGQSGGQQSPEPQGGESPLDSERNRGPQERENTPSEPGEQPQGGEDEQPGGEEPQQEGEDGSPQPEGGPNDPQGENRPAGEQSQDGSGGPSGADDANRWGELPVRYREVFRNQGGEELPVQYREWIDAYHRRLSKSRR